MTGKSSKRRQTSDLVETAERRRFILNMRKGGATYQAVANAAIKHFGKENLPKGFDSRYAWYDIKRELTRINKERDVLTEEVRTLELERLDRMLDAIWGQVTQGHLGAIDRALRISERRARFEGLDAALKTDVTSGGEAITFIITKRDETDED